MEEAPSSEENQMEFSLTGDIEDKLKGLDEFARDKSEEQLVQVRRHQLGIAKVLVIVHNKSASYLVTAHCKLGEAYLNYRCYEQAIEHLTTALKKNSKIFSDKLEAKKCHAHILTLLGKAYLEMGNTQDAEELLNKALEMTQICYGDDDINCASIMTLLANSFTRTGDYDQALDYISKVWDISEGKYGFKSESCALVYLETAKIYAKKEDFEKAVDYQRRALNILVELNIENNPEYIASLYSTLSAYQQRNNDMDGYIDSLDKVKKIYLDLYGDMDKRTIKIKKAVALALLKNNRNDEALRELLETEQLQIRFYGDESVQLAKTLKIVGALHLVQSNFIDAQRYYNRALKIFEDNGVKQAVQDLKKKIKVAREMREKTLTTKLPDPFR
jgi:tetratricopeptide (TPR) repeat protein